MGKRHMAFRRHHTAELLRDSVQLLKNHSGHVMGTCVLMTFCLLAASCGGPPAVQLDRNGIPVGHVSADWISKQPISHLYYPNSKPFYSLNSGSDESAGSGPAYAGAILTSNATGAQIYAWYVQKLRSMGWTFITDNGCADVQVSCPQFGHDGHGQREVFLLAVDNPLLLPSVIGKRPPPACTVYEMSYEVFPPGGLRVPGPLRFRGGGQCWWTGTSWHKPSDVP